MIALPHLVDIALFALAAEAVALALYRHATGRGPRLGTLAPNLVSGGLIMAALRFATAGDGWAWVLTPLTLSLVAHLVDLRAQWRRDG